jgi:Fe2+ transport system protein FeoA
MVCNLSKLAKNETATVVELSGSDDVNARFIELGILPGTNISTLTSSVFGSPLTIKCRGSKLALRPQAAAHIIVKTAA